MLVRYISSHNAWVGLNHPIRMGLMDDLRGCQWIVKTRGDFSFLAYSRFCKHFIPFLNFAIRHNFPAFFIIASPQGGEMENKSNNWPTASVLCCRHQCQFRTTNVELLFISETTIKVAWLDRESFSLEGKNFREQIYSIKLDCLANSCDTNLEQHSQANTQCQLLIPNSGLLWSFFSSTGNHSPQKNLWGQKDLLAKKNFWPHKSGKSKFRIQNPLILHKSFCCR